ncbi:hypothetical protein NF27_GB00020 [Candidatus Jidaibacter acanthamoeba]|uniref:Uncharacterized protein n=1 Tax=Candidatus Jidaibacter acanthamoebae TaxID=86105 RepID=A0A0C1QKS3_9RICK|nr:hypothetical protein [Candidatus Jidaibacter acanthamoeba]KIE04733.1 hypothetical protein NF27_GB00020 [Candidatus Jidaibacter acanthamoeba]
MKIRKIIKFILITMIGFMIGKIGVRELHDSKRPFKFEEYKTGEILEEAVREKFPNGMDVHEAVNILENSGAKCSLDKSHEARYPYIHKGAKYIATCSYQADFLSLNPLISYRIVLQTNANYKLIYIDAMRVNGVFVI